MLNLVVALGCEARPLVEAWGLSPTATAPYRVFEGDARRLTIVGMGRARAADGTASLARTSGTNEAWLNLGVGGHPTLPRGTLVIAHTIRDGAGYRWYPPPIFGHVPLAPIQTVDTIERRYPEAVVYEMEAAGFVPAALRHASAELVQVAKVISDNASASVRRLTRAKISALVEARLPALDAMADALEALAAEAAPCPPAQRATFLDAWHFTATQTHQLDELLRRWEMSFPRRSALEAVDGATSSRAVIARLRERLRQSPLPSP